MDMTKANEPDGPPEPRKPMELKRSVQVAGTSLCGPTMLAILKFRSATLGGQYKSLPNPDGEA